MNISIRYVEIEPSVSYEIKVYELQVKFTCTILGFINIMLSQNDINESFDRVKLIYGGNYWNNLNGNDKLFDHGIKK